MPQKLTALTSSGKEKTIYWDKKEDPSQDDIDSLPDYVESKPSISRTIWNKLNTPITDIATRAGKAVGEPLLNYSESGSDNLLRKAARYSGAFAETFGDTATHTLATPLNLGLTAISGGAGAARGVITRSIPEIATAEKALFAARMAGNDVEATRLASELNAARVAAGKASAIAPILSGIDRGAAGGMATNAAAEGIINKDPSQIVPFALGVAGARSHGNVEIPPKIDIPASAGKFHGPELAPNIHDPIEKTSFEGLSKNTETPKVDWNEPRQQGLDIQFDDPATQQNINFPGPRVTMPKEHTSYYGQDPKLPIQPGSPDLFSEPQPTRYGQLGNTDRSLAITPSPLEPRIAGLDRPTWSKFAEQRNLPLDYDTLQTMETSQIPEVQKATQQVVESTASTTGKTEGGVTFNRTEGYQNPNNPTSAWGKVTESGTKKVADDFFKSNYAVLTSDSPAGKGIANLIDKYRTEVGKTSGEISAAIKDVVSPLNKDQYTQFQQLVDQGGNSSDPMVQNAIDVVRHIDQQFTERATASGLHLKTSTGELVPFTGKDNYWPRMYPPELFKDKPALIKRLIKGGMSIDDATNAVNNARKFGERLIDPQNARVLDLPDHRKDLGALLKHYDDMAHRIGSAEILGVKDIADPETPISQLAAQTKDPVRVGNILRQYLGREGGVSPHEADFVKGVSKFTTAFYLSKFALSNSNQLAFVPVVTSFKSTGKALAQFIRSPKRTWREAEATGALQTVMQEAMRDMGGESPISKAFLIKASEGSNRTISAIAGKYYVNDLFAKAKKGNVRAIKSLEDLTLDTWDNMKGQDVLTDKQVAYGATRVTEKTQGRAQSIDLPYNWDRSPYVNLLLLYKKYAFVQGRLVKDAIKSNPARNIPLLLALFQGAGEVTGDAKAILGGMITGDPGQNVQDRGKYVGTTHPIVNRVVQNYVDSMFLGLVGDALQATKSGKSAMYQTAAGPVISLPIETGGNMVADAKSKNLTVKKSQTLRGLASHVPFIGSGINRYMKQP